MESKVRVSADVPPALLELARRKAPPLLDFPREFSADDWAAAVNVAHGYEPKERTARTQIEELAAAGEVESGPRFDMRIARRVVGYWFPGPAAQEERNGGKNE